MADVERGGYVLLANGDYVFDSGLSPEDVAITIIELVNAGNPFAGNWFIYRHHRGRAKTALYYSELARQLGADNYREVVPPQPQTGPFQQVGQPESSGGLDRLPV